MSYSVVQQSLTAPSEEQLTNAFRGVPGLTAIDALALGRDAIGIFARGYELEMAAALKEALEREGVPTEVLRDGALPQLPEIVHVTRLEAQPEALLLFDSMDNATAVEWKEVFVIAAGRVMVEEFSEVRTTGAKHISEFQYKLMKSVDGRLAATDPRVVPRGKFTERQVKPVDITTKEERHDRFMLEIILAGGEHRYAVNAPKAPADALAPSGATKIFLRQVAELVQHAPHAALNRGAHLAQENLEEPFAYANRIAFHHELIWLLWLVSRAGADGNVS